jgi:hypothetical protein
MAAAFVPVLRTTDKALPNRINHRMSRQILHIIITAFQSAVEYSWFLAADIIDSIVANNSQTVYCLGQLNHDFPNKLFRNSGASADSAFPKHCLGIR